MTDKEVPAFTIHVGDDKKGLRELLRTASSIAEAAISSMHKPPSGPPRLVMHCKSSAVELVRSLMPMLTQQGIRTDTAPVQLRPVPKARQAAAGVTTAARKAGVCRYFAAQQACPFNDRSRRCNFTCWCGEPAGP